MCHNGFMRTVPHTATLALDSNPQPHLLILNPAARVKAAEVADVANLDEGGAADSDDEGGF